MDLDDLQFVDLPEDLSPEYMSNGFDRAKAGRIRLSDVVFLIEMERHRSQLHAGRKSRSADLADAKGAVRIYRHRVSAVSAVLSEWNSEGSRKWLDNSPHDATPGGKVVLTTQAVVSVPATTSMPPRFEHSGTVEWLPDGEESIDKVRAAVAQALMDFGVVPHRFQVPEDPRKRIVVEELNGLVDELNNACSLGYADHDTVRRQKAYTVIEAEESDSLDIGDSDGDEYPGLKLDTYTLTDADFNGPPVVSDLIEVSASSLGDEARECIEEDMKSSRSLWSVKDVDDDTGEVKSYEFFDIYVPTRAIASGFMSLSVRNQTKFPGLLTSVESSYIRTSPWFQGCSGSDSDPAYSDSDPAYSDSDPAYSDSDPAYSDSDPFEPGSDSDLWTELVDSVIDAVKRCHSDGNSFYVHARVDAGIPDVNNKSLFVQAEQQLSYSCGVRYRYPTRLTTVGTEVPSETFDPCGSGVTAHTSAYVLYEDHVAFGFLTYVNAANRRRVISKKSDDEDGFFFVSVPICLPDDTSVSRCLVLLVVSGVEWTEGPIPVKSYIVGCKSDNAAPGPVDVGGGSSLPLSSDFATSIRRAFRPLKLEDRADGYDLSEDWDPDERIGYAGISQTAAPRLLVPAHRKIVTQRTALIAVPGEVDGFHESVRGTYADIKVKESDVVVAYQSAVGSGGGAKHRVKVIGKRQPLFTDPEVAGKGYVESGGPDGTYWDTADIIHYPEYAWVILDFDISKTKVDDQHGET